jgi:hypothetical protein
VSVIGGSGPIVAMQEAEWPPSGRRNRIWRMLSRCGSGSISILNKGHYSPGCFQHCVGKLPCFLRCRTKLGRDLWRAYGRPEFALLVPLPYLAWRYSWSRLHQLYCHIIFSLVRGDKGLLVIAGDLPGHGFRKDIETVICCFIEDFSTCLRLLGRPQRIPRF